jgi:quercetin dioxygenase-like cupin family protein
MNGQTWSACLQTQPYALHRGEGRAIELMEARALAKATTDQTGGAFNLFEVTCRPGYATALHIHYAEDVAVYVLEGVLTVFCGDEKRAATVGSYSFQPRGTPHGFRVDSVTPARILYLTIPAGLDRFMIEHELLTPSSESVMAAARFQIEVLGPLPD